MPKETPRINTTEQSIDESAVPENQTAIVDNLFMYAFPGRKLTESDIDKYVRSNEKLKEVLPHLIQQAFKDKGYTGRESAARMIQHASEQERTSFIQQAFKDEDSFVRESAARMIQYAPEQERTSFIQQAFKDKDFYVRVSATQMIQHAPEQERTSFIQQALKDEKYAVRESATRMIQHAPEQERTSLIQQAFKDKDSSVRELATGMIQYAPEQEQEALYRQIHETAKSPFSELQRLADETPLYRRSKGRFVRKSFSKSGSQTTLLDKVPGREVSLKEQVIVRRIDIPAYLEWKKTFEAYNLWQQSGFDYVPVEPILRIQLPKNQPTKVDVFTGVIPGPAVGKWKEEEGMFLPQIDQQIEKIKQVLQELGIEHGHLHENNFVLYFPRNKDGKADLTKPPRVYVIDFDAAVSSG